MTYDPMLYFESDDANVAHIARHKVWPFEAEEVLRNLPIFVGSRIVDGEENLSEVGETIRGRILVIVSTRRAGRIRVVTAFPAKSLYKQAWLEDQRMRTI
jgi:uncharacterized DUF497 family protein